MATGGNVSLEFRDTRYTAVTVNEATQWSFISERASALEELFPHFSRMFLPVALDDLWS